jgi:hypothetical protein
MARIYLYMAFPPLLPTRHSGEAEDMSADTPTARPPNLLGWTALVVVYVVWGSTYLAIRVGVRDLPPLTLAGVRYLAAGVLLYPIALRTGGPTVRRTDKPGGRQGNIMRFITVGTENSTGSEYGGTGVGLARTQDRPRGVEQ